jgi:MFS family permease
MRTAGSRRHPLISRITAATGTSNLFSAVVGTLLPLLVLRDLALGPTVLGVVVGVGALGGILGAVAAAPLGRRLGEGPLLPIALGTAAVTALAVPLAGTLPGQAPATRLVSVALLVLAELGTSFGAVAYNVTQVSFRQQVCPPHLLGRMNASIRFLVWGVMPIGSLAAGALATALGTVPTMWIGAVGGLFAVAFVGTPRILSQNRLSERESRGSTRD